MLGEDFWRREFAGDPAIVGRTITLDDRSFTIVGVMPRGFAFPFGADLWTPVSPVVGPKFIDNPSWGVLFVVGRLRPEVSPRKRSRSSIRWSGSSRANTDCRAPGRWRAR